MSARRKLLIGLALIAIGLALSLLDLYLWISPPADDTISERALSFAGNHPIIVFMAGILTGHFLWPQGRS